MARIRNTEKRLSKEQSVELIKFLKQWRACIHKHCYLQCNPPRLTIQDLYSDTVERLINFYASNHTVDKFGEEGFIKRLVMQSKMEWDRKQKSVFNVDFIDKEFDDDNKNSILTPIQEEDKPFDSDYQTSLEYKKVIQKMKDNGLTDEQISLFVKRVVHSYSYEDIAEDYGLTAPAIQARMATIKKKVEKIFNVKISGKRRRYLCLETNEVFDTLSDIYERYKIASSSVLISAKSNAIKSGGKINGQYAHWKFFD